tara:strand:- start:1640 stop:3073 length:1434 start_codon:yes stop_codon:yes gene_type:complete
MANIGDLNVKINAKDNTGRAFNKIDKNLNRLKGALAVALPVAVITNFAKSTLELADTIGKTADSVGVSTKFLQQFQFVAQQSGLTTEEFNKGLQTFTKNIGQGGLRTMEATRSLQALGISLNDQEGKTKSAEAVFQELFVALDGVSSETRKAGIMADLFGRAGVKMSVMAKSGSQAMMELKESATGIIPDDSIRRAEEFNDTMNELTREILLPMQVIVIGVANGFLDFLENLGLIERSKALSVVKRDLEEVNKELEKQQERLDAGNLGRARKGIEQKITSLRQQKLELEKEISDLQTKERLDRSKVTNDFDTPFTQLRQFSESLNQVDKLLDKMSLQTMKKLEDSIVDSLKQGKLAFEDFANFVVEQLLRIAIQNKIISPISKRFENFLDSFDGGGFTGSGVRAGGVDGKGGFPAILHPNESIIDHTRGNMTGGINVNFNIKTFDASNFDEMIVNRKTLITSIIQQAMNNRGKQGIL